MKIIDIHNHVLTGIDDGCRNMQSSLEVLAASKQQGINHIMATPHFYASRDRISDFISRRDKAMAELEAVLQRIGATSAPRLYAGAEVAFFKGISRAEGIEELTAAGSRLMLLEMPSGDWDDSMLEEVEYLCSKRGLHIIIAHLERFMTRHNRKLTAELIDMSRSLNLKIQINAESLLDRKGTKSITKMFQKGQAHFLASDCHGMHRRPPNLEQGRNVLIDKLGNDFIDRLDNENLEFMKEAEFNL